MYLSRLLLDTHNRLVRRDLSDCYQLHRTLLSAFPQAPTEAARNHFGLLYRPEALSSEPSLIRVLVQSVYEPDWSRLPRGYLAHAMHSQANPSVRRIDGDYAQLVVGQQLRFRLRANPTKRLSSRNTQRTDRLLGKRIALLKEEEQQAWLQRKGELHGFRLLTLQSHPDVLDLRITAQEGVRGRRVAMGLSFGAVLFEGYLEITDLAAFIHSLQQGIGSGKAFGFGLLSIASVG